MANTLHNDWFVQYLKCLSLNEPFTPNSPTETKYHKKDQSFGFSDNLKKNREDGERCFDDFPYFDFETTSEVTSLPPVIVSYSEDSGRFLQASRDIEAGETIIWEPPLVLSPKCGSGPTCLNCFMSFEGSNWAICENCKCPKCTKDCEGNEHSKLECKILAEAFKETDISSDVKLVKRLNIILTPLRTYLAIKKTPVIKRIVESLQSSSSERKNSSMGEFIEKYVASFFQNEINLDIDSEFVHHVCGVFDTNAFEVTLEKQKQARALLSLSSLMKHSCVPNTQHWFFFGYLVVRACVQIKKGESVTNSYTQALWGTKTRINHLALTKLFKCKCHRCQDPSELGSNLSSIKCQKCKEGLITPTPSEPMSCSSCKETMTSSSLMSIINVASGVVSRAEDMDIDIINKTIQKLGSMIGLQHYTTVKLQFIYTKKIVSQQKEASNYEMIETLRIIESLLQLTAIIEPGLTRTKGILLYYKFSILTELHSRYNASLLEVPLNGEDTNPLLESIFKEDVEKIFEDCQIILKWDPLLEDILDTNGRWKVLRGDQSNLSKQMKDIRL